MRLWLVFLVACGTAQHTASRPTTGSIAGLARDHDSGDPVAKAQIRVRATGDMRPHEAVTDKDGHFAVDHLPPGRYSLSASFAGQPIEVAHIDVRAGDPTIIDVTFTLGHPDPITVEFGNWKDGAIDRYHPKDLSPEVGRIEGTINDAGSRARVAGAVITASSGADAVQTVSDDQGRYRFDPIAPGTYTVSASYNIAGRGEFEVRRSDIHVDGAEAVIVPLWVELTKL